MCAFIVMELLRITRQIHCKAVEQRATLIHRQYNRDWGTSYSRPPIDPYLTSPLLQNPGGTTGVRIKMVVMMTMMMIIISLQSYFYYWYAITHSHFHSRLKSFLFCKSSLPQPFLFLLQDSLYGFPRLFTVTSEHIRLFTFLVFFFCFYTF